MGNICEVLMNKKEGDIMGDIGDPLEVIGEYPFQIVLKNLSPKDRINIELVSKGWKEASSKSWNQIDTLDLSAFLKPPRNEEKVIRKRRKMEVSTDLQRAKAVLERLWKRTGPYVKTLKINLQEEDLCRLTGLDKVLVKVLWKSPPERMEHLRLKGLPLHAEAMGSLRLLFMESKGGPEEIRSLEWGSKYKWSLSCDFCFRGDEFEEESAVYKQKVNSLAALLHSCSVLKKLHISHFPMARIAVQSIPEGVEDLRINFCKMPRDRVFECEWLAKPQLKKIRIENYNNRWNPLNLDAFSVCEQLESVRFFRVFGRLRHPKWLTELRLRKLELTDVTPELGDNFFGPFLHAAHNAPIAQSLKSLKLDVWHCGPGTLKAIAVFSNLENLSLERYFDLNDDDLNFLLPACPRIKKFSIYTVTNRTMAIVGEHCKNLETFVIRSCTAVSDTGVENLVTARFQPNQSISPPFLHIFTRAHKITKNREFHPLVKVVELRAGYR